MQSHYQFSQSSTSPSILLSTFYCKVQQNICMQVELPTVIYQSKKGVLLTTSIINISCLNNFYHSNNQIMMDFLILIFFAYLIFRIVSRFFTNIEHLFQSSPKREPEVAAVLIPPASNQEPLPPSSCQLPPRSIKPIASRESNKPSLSEKVEKVSAIPSRISEKEDLSKRKAAIERQDIEMLRAELSDSLAENERLKEQIEGHKNEKTGYVARIEEIIQHVINNQAPVHQIPAEKEQNDEELKVLGELAKEIDHVHEQEVQRMKQRQEELLERVGQEKQALQRHYLSQIDHITQQLKVKNDELNNEKQKNQESEQDRMTLEGKLAEYQERQEGIEQELHLAQQEAEELRAQLTGTEITQKDTTGSSEALKAQRAECERLKKQLQDLYGVQQEAKDLRDKLNQLREQSNISHNDRLEADIQLNAQVQSLEKQKVEMEAQISQLSENLFREEQERNQIINNAQVELTSKYEVELEIVSKSLEREQEGRKEGEAKLSEVQSELEFVQAQLKATLESERRLNAEIEPLRSPKKVSVSDVQTHAEYLKLKRKVEELESEINNTRNQNASEVKEVSPDRRINYARTKIERQASPTFQFESKNTPSNSSRRGEAVSTIYAGGFEKTSPSSVQRYQTPMQKPVAQSSILEGGLLSEGFLGETSILGQKQREFLIGQIKTLKKIDVKKARLLYRSLGSNPRPIAQYTSNVPNVLVVVELSNKKLVGAFTQAAFTREMGQQSEPRKYSPANKAMLIDISEERIALNASASDTIRYDEHALIWGRNEFVVSSEEPLLLSCDLNCEQAVYPCGFSNQQLLGAGGRNCPISQFEVYRIFLG